MRVAKLLPFLLVPALLTAQSLPRFIEVQVNDSVRLPFEGMDLEVRMDDPVQLAMNNASALGDADIDYEKLLEKSRAHIRDRLTQLAPIFLKNKYMLGEGFSMLDVAIAPLLWRLDYYGIDLSKNAAPLLKYAERIFSRPAYIEALTPSEKVMRK